MKDRISVTIEVPLKKAIYALMADSLKKGTPRSFSWILNDLAKKGLKAK